MQPACGIPCALALAVKARERKEAQEAKRERVEHRAAKERVKTRGQHLKEAQTAFNEWVRLRDAARACISCGRHHDGQYHAGHYRPTNSNPALRFEPDNVWKQCAPCNTHLSGNLVNYRSALLQLIGAQRVEWLEGPHEPRKYTIEDLQAIKADYRAKVRQLKNSKCD